MGSWNDILKETDAAGSTHDVVRRQYLLKLQRYTHRNTIIYYSGWLQKTALSAAGIHLAFHIDDADKNGFMAAVYKLDKTKGLDLILHTPGGDLAATESLVDYLRSMFGTDIRVIVPQLAMSAGTMIALAATEIMMGEHSSLGPTDPQVSGVAAHGVIEEFERARKEIQSDQKNAHIWQPILARYNPTLIGECQKAIDWSETLVKEWLVSGMFAGEDDAAAKAEQVHHELGDHALTLSHNRHISIEKAREIGLKVGALEDDPKLHNAVMSVHHCCILTLDRTGAYKIIENHNGAAHIGRVDVRVGQA